MERFGLLEVSAKCIAAGLRKDRGPVFGSLATTNEDEPLVEIDVLAPQLAALGNAEPSAVDERRHQTSRARHRGKQRDGLRNARHHQQIAPALCANAVRQVGERRRENVLEQEQEGAQRLVLGGSRDFLVYGEMRQVVVVFVYGWWILSLGLTAYQRLFATIIMIAIGFYGPELGRAAFQR